MNMTEKIFRLYAETEKFENVIAFYETAQGVECGYRFDIPERRIKGARIGSFLVLSGSKEDLEPVRGASAVFYVDSLDECAAWLKESGAEILHDVQTNAFGRNLMARNPDGLVVEYFEPKNAA